MSKEEQVKQWINDFKVNFFPLNKDYEADTVVRNLCFDLNKDDNKNMMEAFKIVKKKKKLEYFTKCAIIKSKSLLLDLLKEIGFTKIGKIGSHEKIFHLTKEHDKKATYKNSNVIVPNEKFTKRKELEDKFNNV